MEDTTSKRGRKPIAPDTPEGLMDMFDGYKRECKDDVIIDPRTGAAVSKPLTTVGFMDYLGLGYRWRRFKEYYSAKGELWAVTIARIENSIERNQLEGGLLGLYNPNLTARLNGYSEKTENKHDVSGGFLWKEIE